MKIKPGFIRFRNKRNNACSLTSVKYRHYSRTINYKDCSEYTRHETRLKWYQEQSLSQVIHRLETVSHKNKVFFELVKRASGIRRITLDIKLDPEEERRMKKFMRRLFTRTKRITHIEISLNQGSYQENNLLLHLRLLKFIKKIAIDPFSLPILESLQPFLLSSKQSGTFPCLQSLNILFQLQPSITSDLNESLESLNNILEMIQIDPPKISPDIKLKLPFSRSPELQTSIKLARSLKGVFSLGLGFFNLNGDTEESLLLDILQNCMNLRTLDLGLYGKYMSALANLATFFEDRKPLKKFILYLAYPTTFLPLEKFFDEFHLLSQITDLTLRCKFTQFESNIFLINLSKSLSSLLNLKNLYLDFSLSNSAHITSDDMTKLFEALGNLKNLQNLRTNFNNYKDLIEEKVFITFFDSLKKLEKLSCLALDFSKKKLADQGLVRLQKALERLPNLNFLYLDFRGNPKLTSEKFADFVQSLSKHRNMEKMNLLFECENLNEDIKLAFVSTLYKMKCLNRFTLHLHTTESNLDLNQEISSELTALLKGRMHLNLSIV